MTASPVISPRARAYRAVAQQMGFHAVCLIGWEGPRPAFFGDNRGIWPVRVATSAKEMTAHERADLETPHVGVVVLEYVLVPSAAHAKRLKDALDEVLMGEQEGQSNASLRHRWRDIQGCFEAGDDHGRVLWWGIVLDEARRLLRAGATAFPIYTSAEDVAEMISRKATRGNR